MSELRPAPLLPSVELARARGLALPDGDPFEVERLAALVVDARLLRRTGWSEQKWLSPDDVKGLGRELPSTGQPGAMYHVMGRQLAARAGFVRCQLHHYSDEACSLRDTYVPALITAAPEMAHFEDALRALTAGTPPEALRCTDLAPRVVGAAYRSVPSTLPPDFHGFAYADALARAATTVGGLFARGTVLAGEV
ncbi:MAG: hypothetical protein IT373_33060, partial [Polyangiaceae bacterium]|nr:hypothetical protein [Polyangiaceae bacterium]